MSPGTPVCQVALSVADRARSRAFYEKLGFAYTGTMGPIEGNVPAQLLDLPEIEVHIDWVAGRDPMSQLELIEFTRPAPRPLPPDWTRRCRGFGSVGVTVPDFEATLRGLIADSTPHWVTGGQDRRSIWLKDPDGVLLEILESDPLGKLPAAKDSEGLASIRTLSLTVADLPRTRAFWTAALGFAPVSPRAFKPNPIPPLFSGGAGEWQEEVIQGGPVLLRLMEPQDGKLRERQVSYRLSDLGVLNIAVILESPEGFHALCARLEGFGCRFSTPEPMLPGDNAGTRYGYDDQGNSIEIGFVLPGEETQYGWRR